MFPIKSNILLLHGFAESLQGGRAENQDDWAYLDTPLGFMLVLCDGMGGGPGGKTASYIAKYEIAQAVMGCNKQMPRQQALKVAFGRAQEALSRRMDEMPALAGMGATFSSMNILPLWRMWGIVAATVFLVAVWLLELRIIRW